VVGFDGRVLDRAVHAFGLTVGPRVIGLGQAVFDAVGNTYAVKDMRPQEAAAWSVAVFKKVGEGHPVVGQHGVNLVGKHIDDVFQEGRTFHLSRAVMKLDVGELRDAVDRQEHDQFSLGVTEFAAIDVDVTDLVRLESLPLFGGLLDR
jgi:hypothetical protein